MRAALVVLLLLGGIAGGELCAAEIEQFFMPGKLISGHADLEAECTQCHVRLRDTTQKKLCLDCHELVDEDLRKRRGYHGRDDKASSLDCKACHSDHKGRDARVVWLDQDSFDHANTDFRLSGRHKLAECTACHQRDEKYREAKRDCYACHAEDDAHDGELGEQCQDCHATTGWMRTEFDHDKTDFKLRFSHRRVSCDACHIDDNYDQTPTECAGCHAIRDVHDNRFGSECESCHLEKGWDQTRFDHDRDTDFRIEGRHREPGCNACHDRGYLKKKKDDQVRSCYSCHRADDAHNETNGDQCQDCHDPRGWKYAEFDHDANTDFALNGAHENLFCAACHVVGAESKEIDTACYSCHKLDDSHELEQGEQCEQCHNEVAWQLDVRFDHELSRFPLIGQHAATGCEACHLNSVFRDASRDCVDCHGADDVHHRAFGRECAECHNPNAWLIWHFDHDDTGFRLREAHAEVHCHACHYGPRRQSAQPEQRACVDCHRGDDIHAGSFGDRCDRCHDRKRFDQVSPGALGTFSSTASDPAQ